MTPQERILFMREKTIHLYRSYEKIVLPMVKFFAMLGMLILINYQIGTEENLMNPAIIFILALFGGFCSSGLIILVVMLFTTLHLITFNLLLGLTVAVFFVVLYILFIRLYPKESLLILLMIFAFKFNLEYILLFSTPLFGGVTSLIALIIGVVISFLGKEVIYIIQEALVVGEVKDYIGVLLKTIQETLLQNRTLLVTITIFFIVFLVIYGIRKLSIDYSAYVAIGTGAVINLLGFIMAILLLQIEIDITGVFIMSIIGSVIAIFISFFVKPLDYSRGESVQFEDDDNYYYVKIVPKIRVRTNTAKVKQVYINKDETNLEE